MIILEDYNLELYDLLSTSRSPLRVQFNVQKGLEVKGATIHKFTEFNDRTTQEMLNLYTEAVNRRTIGTSSLNPKCSLAHTIVEITVEVEKVINNKQITRIGHMCLIDLAGHQEKDKSSTVSLDKQTIEINKSLYNLTNLISDIYRKQTEFQKNKNSNTKMEINPTFLRSCNLTRYLSPLLFHNSRVAVLLCASPVKWNKNETLNTLQFGVKMMNLKTDFLIPIGSKNSDTELSKNEEEVENMRNEFEDEKQRLIRDYKNKIEKLNQQHELELDNMKENNEYKLKYEELLKKYNQLKIDYDNLKLENDELKRKNIELEDGLNNCKSQSGKCQAQVQTQIQAILKLKGDIENLKKENVVLNNTNKGLRVQLGKTQTNLKKIVFLYIFLIFINFRMKIK